MLARQASADRAVAHIERHYRIQAAAKLCGGMSRRGFLQAIESLGYTIPSTGRGRAVLVPEYVVLRLIELRAVKPKYAEVSVRGVA